MSFWDEYVATDPWYLKELLSDIPPEEFQAAVEDEDWVMDEAGEEGDDESEGDGEEEDSSYSEEEGEDDDDAGDSSEEGESDAGLSDTVSGDESDDSAPGAATRERD